MSKQVSEDLKGVIHEAVDISAAAGRVIAGVGMRIASVESNPKQCALALLQCGEEFQILSKACNELAAKICDIDKNAVKVVEKGGLCDVNGKPLNR